MEIRIGSANVNSWKSKRGEIEAAMCNEGYAAFCAQETKLTHKTLSSDTAIPGLHDLVRKDRTGNGGGVAVGVRESLNFRPLSLQEGNMEITGAQLLPARPYPPIALLSAYRPPGGSSEEREEWVASLITILARLVADCQIILITGDLNLCLATNESEGLRDGLGSLGFSFLNSLDETTHGRRTIDIAALYGGGCCQAADLSLGPPLERSVDGHALLSITISFPAPPQGPLSKPSYRLAREWAKADWTKAAQCQHLLELDRPWPNDPDLLHQHLCQGIHCIIEECVPKRQIRSGRRQSEPPWMTFEVSDLIQAHRESYAMWRKKRSQKTRKMANRLKAKKRRAVKDARQAYADAVIAEADERKTLWDVHRQLAGKRRRPVPDLTQDGNIIQTDQDKAQSLADTFSKAYQEETDEDVAWLDALVHGPPEPIPNEGLADPRKVEEQLKHLKRRKATGSDNIGANVLRNIASIVSLQLTVLINLILHEQKLPMAWKRAWICPIPKIPHPMTPGHFRPIAIIDSMSKVFDKHLLSLILPYTSCNPRQFGFCARSGCGDALMRLQLDVIEMCKKGSKTALSLVSLDAQKAFDQLKYTAILRALARNGAPRWLLRVVAAWLVGREFQVRVGEKGVSDWFPATSGSPQGASLSAILFRNAIDPVFRLPFNQGTRIIGYADDLLVARVTGTGEDRERLEEDLGRVKTFLSTIGLSLNVGKTQVLNVSLSPAGHSWGGSLRLDGDPLPFVTTMRYLGATLDSRLSFVSHWNRTAASAKAAVGALARLVHRNERALRHLYQERVASVLLHTLPFLAPSTQESWRKVNGVASFTAHLITNRWDVHGTEAIRLAALLPPSELCFRQSMRFMFKCRHGLQRYGLWLLPLEETERATRNRSHQSKTGLEVAVPTTHLSRLQSLQPIRAASTLNSLPFLLIEADTAEAVKSLGAFTRALPALYQALAKEERRLKYGE